MALFFKDPGFDVSKRLTGFNRYRQLLSFYALRWMKVNLLTVLGCIPLCAGIVISLLTSSIVVLIPCSVIGGMIFGPFLAAMFDSVMRGLRDAPDEWQVHYKKSWKQNMRGSLFAGAVFGLLSGMFIFMVSVMYSATEFPGWGTIALFMFSLLLFLIITTLYWPQLVLFDQKITIRLRNIIMFTVKHFWKVVGAALTEAAYIAVIVFLFPWTIALVPFTGFWYIIFLSEFIIYDDLNSDFTVEKSFIPIEGDPWAVGEFDRLDRLAEEADKADKENESI